jgi:hypothetical protein
MERNFTILDFVDLRFPSFSNLRKRADGRTPEIEPFRADLTQDDSLGYGSVVNIVVPSQ